MKATRFFRLFESISIIYYLSSWRLLWLRFWGGERESYIAGYQNSTGGIQSIFSAWEKQRKLITDFLHEVEKVDLSLAPFAVDENSDKTRERYVWPFETARNFIHNRMGYKAALAVIVFILVVECYLYTSIASYLVPGTAPNSTLGYVLGAFMAVIGLILKRTGFKAINEGILSISHWRESRIKWPEMIEKLSGGLLGLAVFVINFYMIWYAASAREAYLLLDESGINIASKSIEEFKQYEAKMMAIRSAVKGFILSVTIPVPIVIAILFDTLVSDLIDVKMTHRYQTMSNRRMKLIAAAYDAIESLEVRIGVILKGVVQLNLHLQKFSKKMVSDDLKELFKDMETELAAGTEIDTLFLRRYHPVLFAHPETARAAIVTDPDYRMIQGKIQALKKKIETTATMSPDYTGQAIDALSEEYDKKSVTAQKRNLHLKNAILLPFLVAVLSSCTELRESSGKLNKAIEGVGKNGRTIVIGIDASNSATPAIQSYQDAALRFLEEMKPNTRITVILISGATQTAGKEILSVNFSESLNDSFYNHQLGSKQKEAIAETKRKAFKDSLKKELVKNIEAGMLTAQVNQTDIFGAFEVAKPFFDVKSEHNALVIFSDGLHDTNSFRMLKNKSEAKAGNINQYPMDSNIDINEMIKKASFVDFHSLGNVSLALYIGNQSRGYTPEVKKNVSEFYKAYARKTGLLFSNIYSTTSPLISEIL